MKVQKPVKKTPNAQENKQFVWDDSKGDLVPITTKYKRGKKSRLDMSNIIETLPEASDTIPTSKSVTDQKQTKIRRMNKMEALKLESNHFRKVLDHPAFKTNASMALHAHIKHKYSKNK